ncbi:MAG: aldose epimerase family protein [Roseobacter sp.]|jgi:aldose 1-epimerase
MIQLHSNCLKAEIAPRGAALTGLWHRDLAHSLVLGAPDPAAYEQALVYFGAIVGPVANRISDAAVHIDGKRWRMEANEGTTCLHGGSDGLHARIWDLAEQSSSHVLLTCTLTHGESGLPGHRVISARYGLDGSVLSLDIFATTDRNTVMNLAHHPYWNLAGTESVGAHRLCIAADTYLPTDDKNLPTGRAAPVAGTPYDFRQPNALPVDVTLDANLCLAEARRPEPVFAARLTAPNAPSLEIHTTESGLQLYNGSGLRPLPVLLHEGQKLAPYAGVALEPQAWPDAPKHPHFPSVVLRKGQKYIQRTRYHISR